MGHASAKAVTARSPKPGTVSAKVSTLATEIKTALHKKLSIQSNNDIKAKVMGNLCVLNDAHIAYKEIYFKQNLPFYTCTDAATNTWKKEFPNGSVEYVCQFYDVEKNELIEKKL